MALNYAGIYHHEKMKSYAKYMQIAITVPTKYAKGLAAYGYYALDNVILLNSPVELMTFAVSYSDLTGVEYFQDVVTQSGDGKMVLQH